MITSTITIRSMAAEDLDQVHALDQRSFSTPWPFRSFQFELHKNDAAYLWVAEAESEDGSKQVVGVIVVWFLTDLAHIATLAVDEGHRRSGVATRLICTALNHLLKMGAESATLEVREGNIAAQRLYHRLGFQLVGRRPAYYKDNNEDAILMTLPTLDEEHLDIIGCTK
jgi:ribosomal-protein-alanine N-acetyltransferase